MWLLLISIRGWLRSRLRVAGCERADRRERDWYLEILEKMARCPNIIEARSAGFGDASALPMFLRLEPGKEVMAMQDMSGNGGCRQIDAENIELHAMGRLEKSSVSEHLDQCSFCRDRVADYRSYIVVLKHGLAAFQQEEGCPSTLRDAGGGSRPDD
jgi:hypothetical protein